MHFTFFNCFVCFVCFLSVWSGTTLQAFTSQRKTRDSMHISAIIYIWICDFCCCRSSSTCLIGPSSSLPFAIRYHCFIYLFSTCPIIGPSSSLPFARRYPCFIYIARSVRGDQSLHNLLKLSSFSTTKLSITTNGLLFCCVFIIKKKICV